jgi:hypothetical protein
MKRRTSLLLLLAVLGCGHATPVRPTTAAAPAGSPATTSKAYLVGVWTRSDDSYAAAAHGAEAWRLRLGERDGSDGVFETGTITGGRFVATPNPGPSGGGYVKGWTRDGDVLTLALDGAEEPLTMVIDGPDRWRFDHGYLVRRADVAP